MFNYKAEVKTAKANYSKMTKALGIIGSIPVAEPAEGGGFKSVKVGGVRLVRFSDQKRGVRPFNYDAGYSLSIVGELPGSVISIEGGELKKALADNGADLLPAREWDRKINFPKLSKDKSTAIFDVELSVPDDDVKRIKELSGTIRYMVAGGTKEVDLGISEFKAGVKGKEFDAVVTSVGKSDWGDGQALTLKLGLKKDSIKEVRIYDETGGQIKISGTSSSWSGNKSELTYMHEKKFPARGKIIFEVYEQQQKYEIPFKIENISLLGQPLK
jgi:hypothetical protein